MIDTSYPAIVIVDKPKDITSSDLILDLKKKMSYKRIGHGGTLDPFATGLLPIFIGQYTKISSLFHDADKEYVATVSLGQQTDSGDFTGAVIKTSKVPILTSIKCQLIERSLLGSQLLPVPIYSARKVNGTPMYKLARDNKIQQSGRFQKIIVHSLSIDILSSNTLKVTARVSSGTYMRSLGELIAKKLSTVGHLTQLRRTRYFMPSGVEIASGASLSEYMQQYSQASYSLSEINQLIPSITLGRSMYQQFIYGLMKIIPTFVSGWHLVTRQDRKVMGLVLLENGVIKNRLFL